MTITLTLALMVSAAPSPSDTWTAFRNDGSSRTTAKNLPVNWSPKEHLAWRVPTTGYGQSSPVIWKDTIFLTSVKGDEKETLIVAAFAFADGSKLWEKTFAASQKGKNNPMMSRAAGTPTVDANGVYAFFESGDLIGLSHTGEVKWQRSFVKEFGEIKNNHGAGSSLAQTDDSLIALVDNQGPSYLVAITKADGKTKWKADRPARNSWTSPVIAELDGKPTIVLSSGGAASAYDAASGAKLWEFDGLKGNNIASPTASGNLIVMAAGDDRMKPDLAVSSASNCCVKLTTKDGKPSYEFVWRAKKVLGNTASPVIANDYAYFVDKTGMVHCVAMKTGELKYSERLDNQVWATPIVAGDAVYFFGKDGVTNVVKVGPEFEKVATNRLWTPDDFAARKEAEKKATKIPMGPPGGGRPPMGEGRGEGRPKGEGAPKGPPGGMSPEELEATRYSAVGDVVYGVAAVDSAFIVRTGTELICVRK